MRKSLLVASSALLSLGLFGLFADGGATLSGSCPNGGSYPNCVGGEITFTGSGYASQVRVTVTNGSSQVIDDADYTTKDGILSFTENLSFADRYVIELNHRQVLTVTTR